MLIGKEWKVESLDSMNVTIQKLVKPSKKHDGTMSQGGWVVVAYHGSVQAALVNLVNIGVKETQLTDLKTVVDKIEQLEKDIMKAIKEAKEC